MPAKASTWLWWLQCIFVNKQLHIIDNTCMNEHPLPIYRNTIDINLPFAKIMSSWIWSLMRRTFNTADIDIHHSTMITMCTQQIKFNTLTMHVWTITHYSFLITPSVLICRLSYSLPQIVFIKGDGNADDFCITRSWWLKCVCIKK